MATQYVGLNNNEINYIRNMANKTEARIYKLGEDNINGFYIYAHILPNNKIYIGQTGMKTPHQRWGSNGCRYLGKKTNGEYRQPHFARAIMRYGWENIEHRILFFGLTQEQANKIEQLLIRKFKCNNSNYGYNIANGGNSKGTHSEETKIKLSKYRLGKESPRKGVVLSVNTKEKIRIKKSNTPIISLEDNIVYPSIREAERRTGICRVTIGSVINNKKGTAGGKHWMKLKDASAKNRTSILSL